MKTILLLALAFFGGISVSPANETPKGKKSILQPDERMGIMISPEKVERIPQYGLRDFTSDPLPDANGRWILGLRLQDDLTSRDDRKPATFDWSRDDSIGKESAVVDAAVLLDIYMRTGVGKPFNYDPKEMAFRFTLGAEWERNDGGGDLEKDIRRYTFGAKFNMFPDSFGNWSATNQPMEFGVTYQENIISGEEMFTFDIDYFPSFTLPFMKNLLIGGRSFYKEGEFMKFVERDRRPRSVVVENAKDIDFDDIANGFGLIEPDLVDEASGCYFFLRPDVGVQFGEGDSLGDLIDNFGDGHLTYGLETGLGISTEWFGRFVLSYRLQGLVPFDNDMPSRLFHEAGLTWKGELTPTSINFTYQRGEQAPTFNDVDVFKVGIGARF